MSVNPFEELQQLVEKAQEERRLIQMGHKPMSYSLEAAANILGRMNTFIKEVQAAKAVEALTPPEPETDPTKAGPELLPAVDPVPTEADTRAKQKAK